MRATLTGRVLCVGLFESPGGSYPVSDLRLSKLVERASMVALGRIETAGDARPVLSYSVLRITSAL